MDRIALVRIAAEWMKSWQRRDTETFSRLHAGDFIDRSAAGRDTDRVAFFNSIVELYEAFPDFNAEISFIAIDEVMQTVAIRWTARGVHKGKFLGISPTGRLINFEGIDIIKCRGGQVVERWGEWNGLEILDQIEK